MKKLLLALALIFIAAPAYAEPCEGFTNAINALEAEMKIAQNQAQEPRRASVPPMQSINQSLDELEKALRDHRAANAQPTQTR